MNTTDAMVYEPVSRRGFVRRFGGGCVGVAGWLIVRLPTVLLAFSVLVIVLHWTIRDRIFVLGLAYFVGQPIVLAVASLLATLLWFRRRRRRLGSLAAGFAVGCSIWTATSSFGLQSRARPTEPTIRVLTWNVARGAFGWERVAERIRELKPDVAILTEAWPGAWNHFQNSLPEYTTGDTLGQVLILARGELRPRTWGLLRPGGFYKHVEVSVAGGEFSIIGVDLPSAVYVSRERSLRGLTSVATALLDRPLLVIGDFNTPPSSVHFERLRRDFRNAFEAAGVGYGATWPNPLPFLHLDQIWVSPAFEVHSREARWTPISDHRPVIAEISLR